MQEMLYSLFAMFSALVGTFLVLKFTNWSRKNSILLIGFAAGVMLSIAFIHLIPEAVESNPNSLIYVFSGFLFMYAIQHFLFFHPCHDEHCHVHLGALSTFGLAMHSFFDGIIISIGFGVNSTIGLLTTLAIILHKMPDGITITGILLHSNMKTKKIISYSLLVALFTPIGTALGLIFFNYISQEIMGIFLAFTAGTFIYLSASDLIPETHKASNKKAGICLFFGVILVAFVGHLLH
ncbi:MAG: ZIP family metal transporter [Endomicrobiaceae bacterium]|jgi:ZIP family zinc transporter/zinc and cadmium transporter|nr:ZIP family metal transporter [Endomicrobiaceae bacterium]